MYIFNSSEEYYFLGADKVGKEGQFTLYSFLPVGKKKSVTFIGNSDLVLPQQMSTVKITVDYSEKIVKEGNFDRTYFSGFIVGITDLSNRKKAQQTKAEE